MKGSDFFATLKAFPYGKPREAAILAAVAAGNARVWPWHEVPLSDGRGSFWAAGDVFSIGTDADWVRVPVAGTTAQILADAFGALLPTPRMSDLIWRAAAVKLAPSPMDSTAEGGTAMLNVPYFAAHNAKIEQQRAGRGGLIAGHKKDIIVTSRLLEPLKPERVAIYGWHLLTGQPIQGVSLVHEDSYTDYSHGLRFIAPTMRLDGVCVELLEVLKSKDTAHLLSHEGPLAGVRYKTGATLPITPATVVTVDPPAVEPPGPPGTSPGTSTPQPVQPSRNAIDEWARRVLLTVWPTVLPGEAPTLPELQAVQAIGRHERFYGWASKPPQGVGAHNWGGVQCPHGPPCGEDCYESGDSHADGTKYVACFKRYPTAEAGAADLLHLLTIKRPSVRALLRTGNLDAIAMEMRKTGYFEAKADAYAGRLLEHAQEIAHKLAEPLAVLRGGGATTPGPVPTPGGGAPASGSTPPTARSRPKVAVVILGGAVGLGVWMLLRKGGGRR